MCAAVEALEDRTLFTALYWDPAQSGTAAGGTGIWNTITAQWHSGSPTGPLVAWNNSANNDAIFSGTSAVSLAVPINARSLTFKSGNYSIAGNTLNLATSNARIDVMTGATVEIDSAISAAAGLNKVDGGTLVLAAANNITGQANISGGVLKLANSNAVQNSVVASSVANGVIFNSGIHSFTIGALAGSRALNLFDTTNQPITLNLTSSGRTSTYSGILQGSGVLNINGANQTLSGANTFTGGVNLIAGQLNLNNAKSVGAGTFTLSGGAIDNTTGNAITLKNNNPMIWAGDFAYLGHFTLNLGNGPVSLTGNRVLNIAQKSLTIGGTISDSSQGFGITKNGFGSLVLNAPNTFTGQTIVNHGVIQLANANALQNSTVITNLNEGLRFSAGITSFGIGALAGSSSQTLVNSASRPVALAVGANQSSNTYSGVLGGPGSLILAGGALSLVAKNTYTGGTTINSGTLILSNSSGSATGTGPVTVNAGASLGGAGITTSVINVKAGGTIAPGLGATAILHTANLNFSAGSNLLIDVNANNAGAGYDQLQVTGVANIAAANLSVAGLQSIAGSSVLDIIHTTSALVGNFANLSESQTLSSNGIAYSADYNAASKHDFTLTAIASSSPAPTLPAPTPVPPVVTAPAPQPPQPPTPLPAVPAIPSTPIVTAPSSSEIDINWSAVTGATGYLVQRSTSASSGWATIATPSTTSWADLGQSPSTIFYYRVAATNTGGTSAYSASASTASLVSNGLAPALSGTALANDGVVYTLNLLPGNTARYAADAIVQTWTIDWGDGTPALPDVTIVPGQLSTANHTYTTNAPRTISATAKNAYGIFGAIPFNLSVANAPVVTSFQINDGTAQRSMVDSLTVNFDQPVQLAPGAFALSETASTSALTPGPFTGFQVTPTNNGSTYVVTFSQSSFPADVNNSLPDGTYTLDVVAPQVTSSGGAMQFDAHFDFYRLLGDSDGTAAVPTVSLNPIAAGTAATSTTISATAAPFDNNGDSLSYQWSITDPNGNPFTLPGGNVTTADSITLIPTIAGSWTASVIAIDTDLSRSAPSAAQTFNINANTTAQSLGVTFNNLGLSQLSYGSTVLAGPGTTVTTAPQISNLIGHFELLDSAGNFAMGTSAATTISGTWNGATKTETYTFPNAAAPVVTIAIQYVVVLNTLSFDISVVNSSPYTLNGFSTYLVSELQFPEQVSVGPIDAAGDKFGGGPQFTYVSDQPSYVSADFGTGTAVLGVAQQSPAYLMFYSNSTTSTTNTFSVVFNTNAGTVITTSQPTLNSPIPPGQSATYNVDLRFGPTGSSQQLSADYSQAFATTHPFDLQWTDRRPITEIYLSSTSYVSPTNPRGWVVGGATPANVTTTAGLQSFSNQLLSFADSEIKLMKQMGSQGMITWDMEGAQWPGAMYIGDPTLATALAPELAYNDVIGQYFAKFRSAGLRVGMTLRNSQIKFVNGQPTQQAPDNPLELLISKIEYAKKNWGATLFYIDSSWSFNTTFYDLTDLLAAVHAAEPDVLVIPEQTPVGGLASAAAYEELPAPGAALIPGKDGITSSAFSLVYPNAFSVIRSDKDRFVTEADVPALTEGISRGDTYFLQSSDPALKDAFDRVALQDTFTTGQANNNDTFVLRLFTPADPTQAEYQIARNGLVIDSFPASSTTNLNFNFTGINDNLIIDTTTGNPVPTGGVSFNASTTNNADTLTIIGPLAPANINVASGSTSVGGRTVSFTNLTNASANAAAPSPLASAAALVATPEEISLPITATATAVPPTPTTTSSWLTTAVAPSYSMLDWFDGKYRYGKLADSSSIHSLSTIS